MKVDKIKLLEELIKLNSEEASLYNDVSIDRTIFKNEKSDTIIIDSSKVFGVDELIAVRKHNHFIHYPRHSHDFIEIAYMLSGSATHIINNTEVVLRKGDILLLNQYVEHEILKTTQEDLMINIIVHTDFFLNLVTYVRDDKMGQFFINSLHKSPLLQSLVSHHNSDSYEDIEDLIFKIIVCLKTGLQEDMLKVKLYMGLLMLDLIGTSSDALPNNKFDKFHYNEHDNKIVFDILNYINKSYQTATLWEIAKLLRQSDYTVSKFLKTKLGLTFTELLQNKRLEVASRLLYHSSLSIFDIGVSVGYENTNYFYKIFKAKYGVLPGEYRKKTHLSLATTP